MVESLEFACALAELNAEESALLASPAAPIVLVRRRAGAALSAGIAPGNDHIGVMLPYSPLHLLLVRDARRALVMTSANLPGEPLCATADEMRARFAGTADALLLHDRPIHQRCDDGVVSVAAGVRAPIRRSRGATPRAIEVPLRARRPVLGVGGDIKNTFCLLSGRSALMSQYVGTLENASTQQHFVESLARLKRLTGIEPVLVAHDLHPASASRALAERLGVERVAVQHHHAHVAACLAENGHAGRAIGIAFDGTGYGTDGAIWGGEALIAGSRGFERIAHLEYLPLAGGDAAIRHPARIAASYLIALTGGVGIAALREAVGGQQVRIISRMVERGINTVPTSSCGRLFDAVAALLGVRYDVTYEAQAAIELESLARGARDDGSSYDIALEGGVVRLGPLFAGLADDLRRGVAREIIARRFHATVARMVVAMARAARAASAIDLAALSGGCFQNRILLADAVALLRADGFEVVTHRAVPANDGGLALGQAVVAAALDSTEQTEVADVPWRAG
jgi:hydrogenase maturation protein HypF